jgi:hypothetical protein
MPKVGKKEYSYTPAVWQQKGRPPKKGTKK